MWTCVPTLGITWGQVWKRRVGGVGVLSAAEVRLGYPRSVHSLKEEVLQRATWGYVRYPQDLPLVTTNTYIK
jgi:hypothetical protein